MAGRDLQGSFLSEMHLVSRDVFAGPMPFLACKCPRAPVLSSCQHFIPHSPWQGQPTPPPKSLFLLVAQIIPHFQGRDSLPLAVTFWALMLLLRVCLSAHGTSKVLCWVCCRFRLESCEPGAFSFHPLHNPKPQLWGQDPRAGGGRQCQRCQRPGHPGAASAHQGDPP